MMTELPRSEKNVIFLWLELGMAYVCTCYVISICFLIEEKAYICNVYSIVLLVDVHN